MMEYAEIIRIFLRRWWLILLPLLLSALVALPQILSGTSNSAAGFSMELRYSAAQELNRPGREGDYSDIWIASQHTVNALTDWARTSSFRLEIMRHLAEVDISLDSLSIAADNVRNVGVLYLSHADSAALSAIGDAAMLVLAERNQTYFPQLGGEAAQVTILDSPAIRSTAPALTNRFAPFVQLGLALIIGLALAVFAEFVDPTIYHQNDLRTMGLPVLGSIPRHRV